MHGMVAVKLTCSPARAALYTSSERSVLPGNVKERHNSGQRSVLKYLSPESQAMVTTVCPR